MTELETASRAAASAMGLNPATEWRKAQTVAEAVLAAVGSGKVPIDLPMPMEEYRRYAGNPAALATFRYDGLTTSDEVAKITAKGLKAPDTLTADEIQSVCASALVQR